MKISHVSLVETLCVQCVEGVGTGLDASGEVFGGYEFSSFGVKI
jgi:hypothetical protein